MKKILMMLIITAFLFPACTQQRRVRKTENLDTNQKTSLRGDWNDTDSQETAKAMIEQMIAGGWLKKAVAKKDGETPIITVGKVKNQSSEHLNVDMFVKDLQKSLINSGEVEFVTGQNSNRTDIRTEVKDQVKNASDDTAKGPGEESGADYILFGQLNSIIDRSGGRTIRFYQVELELHEVGTNRIVWMGQKKIKRLVRQKRRTW